MHRDLRREGDQKSRGRWITAMLEPVLKFNLKFNLNYIKEK